MERPLVLIGSLIVHMALCISPILEAGATTYSDDATYSFSGVATMTNSKKWKNVAASANVTFMAWIKIKGLGQGEVKAPRIMAGKDFCLHVGAATGAYDGYYGLSAVVYKNSSESLVWTVPHCLPPNEWVHVAITLGPREEGDKGAPVLFVNGRSYRDDLLLQSGYLTSYGSGYVYLGNTRSDGSRPFEGDIAKCRYDTTVLSDATIASLAATTPDGVAPKPVVRKFADDVPVIDISAETWRQTVIAAGTEDKETGHFCHPSTVLTPDGKTLYCAWTYKHGGLCGPFARSDDGGYTWSRLDGQLPAEYATYQNCPTLQLVPGESGGFNICAYSSCSAGVGVLIKRDGGRVWQVGAGGPTSNTGMPPTGFIALKDGTGAVFGQVMKGDGSGEQNIGMAATTDGGASFGASRVIASVPGKDLCEPFAFRSPDGDEIAVIMRENHHDGRSMMCFSSDEGRTWTTPVDTCWGLTGDRHEGVVLPDGRLFIAFRDKAIDSSTYNQYVAWVGTYDDFRNGRPGQCRIHLLKCYSGGRCGGDPGDNGYSGVELLPDGTILCTTYLRYWNNAKWNSIVCTRLDWRDLPPAVRADGLIAQWKMDEVKEENGVRMIKDDSGNGRHLALGDGCVLTNAAFSGHALWFNGTKAAVGSFTCPGLGERTYSMMIYHFADPGPLSPSENSYPYLLSGWSGMRAHYQYANAGSLTSYCGSNPAVSAAVTPGRWDRYVWTVREANATQCVVTFYLNGIEQYSKTYPKDAAFFMPGEAGGAAYLGNLNATSTRPVNGIVDEVCIYDRALSAAEIAGNPGMGEERRLVGRWKMDAIDTTSESRIMPCVQTTCSPLALDGETTQTNSCDGSKALWTPGTKKSYLNYATVYEHLRDFTFAGWINMSSLSATPAVEGNVYPRAFKIGTVGELQLDVSPDSKSALYYPANGTGNINGIPFIAGKDVWSHFAITAAYGYDESTGQWTETLRFFRDGVLVRQQVNALAHAPMTVDPGDRVYLGSANMPTRGFTGALDDVRLYAGALDDDEIARLHNPGTSLLGHWQMDRIDVEGTVRTTPCETEACSAISLQYDTSLTNGYDGSKAMWTPGSTGSYLNYATYDGEEEVLDFTFAGWINMSSLSATPAVEGNVYPRAFKIGTVGELQLDVSPDSKSALYYPANGTGNINGIPFIAGKDVWSHFAITAAYAYDVGSDKWTETLTFYCNGKTVKQQVNALSASPRRILPGDRIYFGSANMPTRGFTGALDEIRFYAGALTAGEIARLHHEDPVLLGHWRMDACVVNGAVRTIPCEVAGCSAISLDSDVSLTNGVGGTRALWSPGTLNSYRNTAAYEGEKPVRDFTFAGWINMSTLSATPAVSGNQYPRAFKIGGVGSLQLDVSPASSSALYYPANESANVSGIPFTVQKDNWSHFAVSAAYVYDSAQDKWNETLKFYRNGVVTKTQFNVLSSAPACINPGDKIFFCSADLNNRAFTGALDEIRFYSGALSDSEVVALHDALAEINPTDVVTDDLIHHWTFDGGGFDRDLVSGTAYSKAGDALPFLFGGKVGNGIRVLDFYGYINTGVTMGENGTENAVPANDWRTFSFWAYHDPVDTNESYEASIVSVQNTLSIRYNCQNGEDGFTLYQQGVGGAATKMHFARPKVDPAGRWTHVVAIFGRNASTCEKSELWIDGRRQTPASGALGAGRVKNGNVIKLCGFEKNQWNGDYDGKNEGHWTVDGTTSGAILSRTFPGIVDDLRIYSRKLQPREIWALAERKPEGLMLIVK